MERRATYVRPWFKVALVPVALFMRLRVEDEWVINQGRMILRMANQD
jgi:hypothetical protein